MENFYIQNTFRAFAEAFIPRTPRLAEEYGRIQYYGAVDSETDQFLIYELEHYPIPMAQPVAELLNAAATQQLLDAGYPGVWDFTGLSQPEQLEVIQLLNQQMIEPELLPEIFQRNPDLIPVITATLNSLILLGYYSEWSGYGSTRLYPPEERVLEFTPVSWMQTGYPGPSPGYRVLRPFMFT
ncbi:hypothetical protein HNQ56_000574 [Anaerotaenia torta]|uniref:hypothetical protein n=1 Tax=Anaerotaenia torta TaxID=433293 RepID=UPI003D1B2E83